MSLYQGDKPLSRNLKHASRHASDGSDPITPESIGAAPASHTDDTTLHITNSERNAWNAKLDSYTETDPTVPDWAKEPTKPTYTADEVGAVPTSRTVNGKALSSDIILNASDIGVSRPNLLDNSYWASPDAIIDQRGGYVVPPGTNYWVAGTSEIYQLSSYQKVIGYYEGGFPKIAIDGIEYATPSGSAVRGYTGAGYGIDRFKIYSGVTGNLIVKDGYIEVSLTGLYSSLMQVFEKGAIVEGTYTLSVLTTSGLYEWTFEASKTTPATAPIGWFGIQNGYSYFNYNTDGTSNLYLFDNASSETISVSAIAVKLELGDQQTLAHQGNGNWVLNDPPPPPAAALAECQRYYFDSRYKNNNKNGFFVSQIYSIGSSVGSNVHFASGPEFPVTMRTTPSITFYSGNDRISGKVDNANGVPSAAVPSIDSAGVNGIGQIRLTGVDDTLNNAIINYYISASADL